MLSWRPIQLPPPGRNDCGPGGRRGIKLYHTTARCESTNENGKESGARFSGFWLCSAAAVARAHTAGCETESEEELNRRSAR
jgi:hypothetical protein